MLSEELSAKRFDLLQLDLLKHLQAHVSVTTPMNLCAITRTAFLPTIDATATTTAPIIRTKPTAKVSLLLSLVFSFDIYNSRLV